MLAQSKTLWRSFESTLQPQPDTYRETLYHFDETLKCMIRSCVAFQEPGQVKDAAEALSDLLPSGSDPMDDCNIRYVWGIWFQVILVICRLGMDQEYAGLYPPRLMCFGSASIWISSSRRLTIRTMPR